MLDTNISINTNGKPWTRINSRQELKKMAEVLAKRDAIKRARRRKQI